MLLARRRGGLSSANPNLQNIPIRSELGREIRAAFVPADGNVLLSADYSQIELRLMAHFSEDPLLLKAYRENVDIHTLTASEVFGIPIESMDKETRNRAKAVNFGIVYGISPFGLAQQLNIEPSEARIYIDRYFERYSGVKAFIEQTLEQVRQTQSVRTLFGRVRPIPDITSRNANMRGFSERTAVNTPLQGTAADLIKLAMIRVARELREQKLRTKMVLQVHDELVLDVPTEEVDEVKERVRQAMEQVIELKVPIVADVAVGPKLARPEIVARRLDRFGCRKIALQRSDSEFCANCICDAVSVVSHHLLRFRFDHDPRQSFSSRIANHHSAVAMEFGVGIVNGGYDGWNRFERLFLPHAHIHNYLRKDLQIFCQSG